MGGGVDPRHENKAAEDAAAFDAHKAFVAHAFALREENAKLVGGLFEAGAEMHRVLSWHMASESMKAYAACIRAFTPRKTTPEAEKNGSKESPTTPSIEDHEKLCFEEIAARLIEADDSREAG